MKDQRTVAALFAELTRLMRQSTPLSTAGFRVVSPRAPEEIVSLLHNVSCVALLINNTLKEPLRSKVLSEVREQFPQLLVVHVFHEGELDTEPLADANVNVTQPEHLVIALETLLRRPRARA